MKKFIFIILLLNTVLVSAEKPLVVSTASIFADMTVQIGDSLIEVKSIVPIGGDPHTYDPKPSDLVLLSKASLIFKNGLTFEKWMDKLFDNSGTDAKVIRITEGIIPIGSDSYENTTDPHAWMDAENGLIYAKNIYEALLELLPEQKAFLTKRYEAYCAELKSTELFIKEQIASIPENQRILITSHDAFKYYGKKYGLRLESILGTSTDAEAQTRDIERLVSIIKTNEVPAVFIETTVNPKMLKQIATDNNIQIGGSLYSDSIGDKDSEAPTYLDMLRFNTKTITEALTMTRPQLVQKNNDASSMAKIFVIIGAGLLIVLGFFISKRIA